MSGTREYGAFGENIAATGVGVLDEWSGIPFGFSTKYQDRPTGHYYYGYRFYDANTGRWLSRDPIEEQGGLNLYAFVGNNGVNSWDMLGLWGRFVTAMTPRGYYAPAGVDDVYKLNPPTLDLHFKFEKGFSVTGCASTGIPGLSVCLTGSSKLNVGNCCKKDKTKGRMAEISGSVIAIGSIGTPGRWSIQYNIVATEVDFGMPECPDETNPSVSGTITAGAGVTVGAFAKGASCSYIFPGGGWSCSGGISAELFSGGVSASVYVGGGVIVSGKYTIE